MMGRVSRRPVRNATPSIMMSRIAIYRPRLPEMLRCVFFLSAFVMRFPAPFALPFKLFHGRDVLVHANGVDVAAFYADDAVCHGGKRRIVRDDDDGHAVAAAGILQKL